MRSGPAQPPNRRRASASNEPVILARLEVGICGEHGGDPASVAFRHELGLDYVSCAPGRVPIGRLAAAHAALGHTPTDR